MNDLPRKLITSYKFMKKMYVVVNILNVNLDKPFTVTWLITKTLNNENPYT